MPRPPPPPPPPRPSSSAGRQRDANNNPPPPPPSPSLSAVSAKPGIKYLNHADGSSTRKPHDAAPHESFFSRGLSTSVSPVLRRYSSDSWNESATNNNLNRSGEVAFLPFDSSKDNKSIKVNIQRNGNMSNGKSGNNNTKPKNKNSNQVVDRLLSEDESANFKKFCSVSLSEMEFSSDNKELLESSSRSNNRFNNNSNNNNNNNNNQNHSSLAGNEFNSSLNFTPRPVRVTQLEDNWKTKLEDNEHFTTGNDSTSTPRSRSKSRSKTVATTSTFVTSVRNNLSLDNTNHVAGGNTTPMETTPGFSAVSQYSGKIPNNSIKTPPLSSSYPKSPSALASKTTPTEVFSTLPDNVDKKGRCLRHPNVKRFKKKLLGGYELLCVTCPNCEEEAPYESLWRDLAKKRKGPQQRELGRNGSFHSDRGDSGSVGTARSSKSSKSKECKSRSKEHKERKSRKGPQQRELKNDSFHSDKGDCGSVGTARSSKSSKSKERKSRSKERKEPQSRSKERKERKPRAIEKGGVNKLGESASSLPYVPSLYGEEDAVSGQGGPPPGRRSPAVVPPPPPPGLPPSTLNQTRSGRSNCHSPLPSPPSRRKKSIDKRTPIERVRSLSAKPSFRRAPSMSSDSGTAIAEERSVSGSKSERSVSGSKSIFEQGIDKLSSLHSRARSSSRKRASSVSAPGDRSLASSYNDFSREGGAPSISSRGRNPFPVPTKKIAPPRCNFDKKTGRCKNHPSVILAQKSKFSHGYDIIRKECPICIKDSKGDDDEDCEFSKKKMNSLLRGRSVNANGVNCQSFESSLSDPNTMGFGDPRSTNHSSPRKFSEAKQDGKTFRRQSPSYNQTVDNTASVSRMPYTTPSGESGWYTGSVNNNGKPHGQGRMRYKNGNKFEGEWTNGYSAEFIENQGRMKNGFGTNIAKWKENFVDPARNSSSNGSRRLSVERRGSGQQQQSPPMYQGVHQQAATPQAGYHSSPYGGEGGQYQAVAPQAAYHPQYQDVAPQAAYHPSSYGMIPYNNPEHHQAGGAMMPGAGSLSQSSGYHQQSPGYHQQSPGYHQCYPPTESPGGRMRLSR